MKVTDHLFGLNDEVVHDLSMTFSSVMELEEVIIFGSRAMGNYSEGSDIDLAVKGNNLTLDTILEVKSRIADLGLLYKVDVVNYHGIRDRNVVAHIDRVGKVMWKRRLPIS